MSYSLTTAPGVIGPISLSPWANFDKVWTAVVGYPAAEFEFVMEKTPLSTVKEAIALCSVYLLLVLGGREVMRNQPAFKLNTLFKIHNFVLTLVSGCLLVLFIEQIVPSLWKYGIYRNICDAPGWSQPLVTLYYINYLIKYVELLDTVFLVLKKKPLTFLHCYHHPATAILCWTQLAGSTPISWLPITLNLTVHVVMYWYYFQSARGIRVSWKKLITIMQIAQFVIDLGFVYFGTYDYYVDTHYPHMPHIGCCAGAPWAAVTGDLILLSYLILFISFYFSTYRKKTSKKAAVAGIDRKTNIGDVLTKNVCLS
ncbi:Elongation of fatty acids protein 2 [Golovinomyces cichoracearum]|uniref:Elongation of fatty acids protein n=1 Tax=Golovinomyces cichoracearum TaxID=62708 RepID=A0A420IIZ0_9PEZI|nr:Elongation of fatty acids protein 2 [Golovinomyces cichoracearum]